MVSTFYGLNTAARGLAAQQTALNTVSHNIANANTPGYSRQEAVMAAGTPYTLPGMSKLGTAGQLGTGVEITEVRQIRDEFLDSQYRKESVSGGYYEAKQYAMDKLQYIFNEPSDSGLQTSLNEFWQSLEELANDPSIAVNRELVAERGTALAETINHLGTQLLDLRNELNDEIKVKADEVNDIAKQIARLNVQIKSVEVDPKMKANDWRDQRNLLIDQLSKLINISVQERPEGDVKITVGGQQLVDGATANAIMAVKSSTEPYYYDLKWENNGAQVKIDNGYLKGLLDSRDPSAAEDYLTKLDNLAQNLYTGMNLLQQTGYGQNKSSNPAAPYNQFFIIDPSKTTLQHFSLKITMNSALVENIDQIAAAANPETNPPVTDANGNIIGSNTYDGGNALQMANMIQNGFINAGDPTRGGVKLYNPADGSYVGSVSVSTDASGGTMKLEAEPPSLGTPAGFIYNNGKLQLQFGPATYYDVKFEGGASFEDSYRAMLSDLGVAASQTDKMVTNQNLLVENIDNLRQSVMGVSLDEEMTNMIKFQHAYSAAARVVTAMDEMIDTIVNRLGTVGR